MHYNYENATNEKSIGTRIFLVVVMLIGIVAMVISGKGLYDRSQKSSQYLETKGEITDVLVHENESNATFAAEYTYKVDGQTYVIYDDLFTSRQPVKGSEVGVRYNPEDPQEAFVKGSVSAYMMVLIIGFMFLAIPFLMFVFDLKMSEKVRLVLPGLLAGTVFMAIGFGMFWGLKINDGLGGIVLILFGCLGVYMVLGSVYMFAFGKKPKQNVE